MAEEEHAASRTTWLRIGSFALIVTGLGSYLLPLISVGLDLTIPLAELRVDGDLATHASLPAKPGDLRGYNLVLITLDTTRPDRLGLYGNREIETSTVDRLGKEGVVFTNAKATTSSTLPTHASILTGLYPHRHGARVNSRNALPSGASTLAEMLNEGGYDTGAFVSAFVLAAKFGLAQGFDRYDAKTESNSFASGYSERSAEETTKAAIAWLERHRRRPYFLWVHYFDPHAPYEAPETFADRAENQYDAELASVDYQLGKLLSAIEAPVGGSKPKTLVVLTADHGEALGEHGERTHALLVQEATIAIPLVFYATEGLKRGAQVSTSASQVDLLPTIASLLGLAPPEDIDGVDLTLAADPSRVIVTESVYGQHHYGWAPVAAVYRDRWKYVASPQPELYDLVDDPLERTNLIRQRPAEAAELEKQLRRARGDDADRHAGETLDLRPDEVARLRSLGYVAGGASTDALPANRPDPKAMLPLLIELSEIVDGRDNYKQLSPSNRVIARIFGKPLPSDLSELLQALEAFESAHPDFAPVHYHLSTVYAEAGLSHKATRARVRLEELMAGGSGR